MQILLHPKWDEITKLGEVFKLFRIDGDNIADLAKLHGVPACTLLYPTEKPVEKFELADQVEIPTIAYEKIFFQHYESATGHKFDVKSWGRFRKELKEVKEKIKIDEWPRILVLCTGLIKKLKDGGKMFGTAFKIADTFKTQNALSTILGCLNWIRSEMSAAAPKEIVYGKKQ